MEFLCDRLAWICKREIRQLLTFWAKDENESADAKQRPGDGRVKRPRFFSSAGRAEGKESPVAK